MAESCPSSISLVRRGRKFSSVRLALKARRALSATSAMCCCSIGSPWAWSSRRILVLPPGMGAASQRSATSMA